MQSVSTRHRILPLLALFLLLRAGLFPLNIVHSQSSAEPPIPADQVAVKLRPNANISTIANRYNATIVWSLLENRLYILKLPAGQTAAGVLPALNMDPDLYYAEPDYYSDPPGGSGSFFHGNFLDSEASFFHGNGDPLPTPPPGSPEAQWAWNTVNLSAARTMSTGQNVVVAVLDTGLGANHPLVANNMVTGYDFVGMDTDPYDRGNDADEDGDGKIDESTGHGTHVAGMILTAAPQAKIMAIRVLNSDGFGTYQDVANGIYYAVDHGAKVINMSLSAIRIPPALANALSYAASRGVLIVSAAGVGPGPNYPAAYSSQLAVIGVGATDQNDAVTAFSGGRPSDTDVFAPGKDIYSAYPYDGYIFASGTSMAASIVSGEAAMLIARYPNWSAQQVAQQIINKGTALPGTGARRVNLNDALTTGIAVHYANGDVNTPVDPHIKPRLQIVNNTSLAIPLSELRVRYWLTSDGPQGQVFECDFAAPPINCNNVFGNFTPASGGNLTSLSSHYVEVGFTTGAGSIAPGGSTGNVDIRLHKADWSFYNENNDYSYDPTKTAYAEWTKVTLYRTGTLIWGTEPSGGGTQPTNTSTTASTLTATNTPTRTPTRTNTPVVATASPTRTPTRNATSIPTRTATQAPTNTSSPSLTPTRTLAATATLTTTSIKLQYKVGDPQQPADNQIRPSFVVNNTGASVLPLSEIKIRYWYTIDSEQPQTFSCDFLSSGCQNMTASIVKLPSARANADYYVEIGFTVGAGNIAAGASSTEIVFRFWKADWSNYNEANDYSYNGSFNTHTDWSKVTVYRSGVLVWGTEP